MIHSENEERGLQSAGTARMKSEGFNRRIGMAMEVETKWMGKFFPRASEEDKRKLLSLWRRMERVHFPPVVENEIPEKELLANFPKAEDIENLTLLGQGSYGVVHQVKWNGKPYAMKIFSHRPSGIQELKIQSKLDYPHIVPIIAYAEIPRSSEAVCDQFGILMELMNGSIDNPARLVQKLERSDADNSAQLVQNLAEFERSDALEIMLQLARALMFTHSKNIIHRDVKPGNVLYRLRRSPSLDYIRGQTEIKVTDFGISRLVHEGSDLLSAKKGTKCYWAPEVVRDGDKCPYNHKADVYSFAMTCYAIATGKTPLEEVRGCWMRRSARPRIPRWMDRSLARIIKQCWASSPEERPPMKIVCWALEFLMAKARNIDPELSPALYPSSS